ncbi:protein [Scardovia inopinata]|uniref:Uncharacterized protein n=2 Tax=Scardovia inopinata TaxID=78259 RepID=W5IK29_SCAIO|nr:DUF6725 family protein [Scardovia inopinata]EFG27265.1 hypothetical protein HMPREF9020_00906 [Scardovia inopinata F0304]SUV50942.1 protein [Scardovia inopinata]
MQLPSQIPPGIRLVVRVRDGKDEYSGHQLYRDYLGHVQSWDGKILILLRDAAAHGKRPEEEVSINAADIVRLKPIPERRPTHKLKTGDEDYR